MEYQELIAKALGRRSVNQAAKDWHVPQQTMDRYAKAKTMPDYQTAMHIAQDSGVSPGEVMAIFAREEAKKKPRSLFPDLGYAAAALLVSVNLFLTPSPAEAAPALKAAQQELYIMLNRIRESALKVLAYFRQTFTPATA
jgi:transcriptional regulator with XRE-family HTH domain